VDLGVSSRPRSVCGDSRFVAIWNHVASSFEVTKVFIGVPPNRLIS
jgi:hypothetical protein